MRTNNGAVVGVADGRVDHKDKSHLVHHVLKHLGFFVRLYMKQLSHTLNVNSVSLGDICYYFYN